MRVLLGVGVLALLAPGCDRLERTGQARRVQAEKAPEQVRSECASGLTYARLKEFVFDEAARIRNSDPRRLDQVAAYSVVRMEEPVVKSRDDQLNITVCTGQFVLNLPPGIQDAFDGLPVIKADVEYAAQAAADGSGLVYSMSGAEPIIYRIATLGLRSQSPLQIPAATTVVDGETREPQVVLDQSQPSPRPPTASKEAKPTPVGAKQVASAERDPVPRATATPSFKCRHAKTSSEKMVCNNGSLAAADRRMSAVFYSEMARAPAETKRALRRSRDKFLAKRERCSSEACVARVYEERVAEIRRIGGH